MGVDTPEAAAPDSARPADMPAADIRPPAEGQAAGIRQAAVVRSHNPAVAERVGRHRAAVDIHPADPPRPADRAGACSDRQIFASGASAREEAEQKNPVREVGIRRESRRAPSQLKSSYTYLFTSLPGSST